MLNYLEVTFLLLIFVKTIKKIEMKKFTLIFLLTFLMLNSITLGSANLLCEIKECIREQKELSRIEKSNFSLQNLQRYLTLKKVPPSFVDLAIRQAILETGWFSSYSFNKRNNLFGLSYNGKLITFNHWTKSVKSYIKTMSTRNANNFDCPYEWVTSFCYAEDPDYKEKLKKINFTKLS